MHRIQLWKKWMITLSLNDKVEFHGWCHPREHCTGHIHINSRLPNTEQAYTGLLKTTSKNTKNDPHIIHKKRKLLHFILITPDLNLRNMSRWQILWKLVLKCILSLQICGVYLYTHVYRCKRRVRVRSWHIFYQLHAATFGLINGFIKRFYLWT